MERIRTNKGITLMERLEETLKNDDYIRELNEIKGIGDKTVSDILRVFPTLKSLKLATDYPFRDDISEKLKEYTNNG